MTTTLTDPRPRLCQLRHYETNRLALLRAERTSICGCLRCGDEDRGSELNILIALCRLHIAEYEDRICEWQRVNTDGDWGPQTDAAHHTIRNQYHH